MAQATVLEIILDGLKPKKKKVFTKRNVVQVLNIASKLMAFAVVKQPALIPVQGVLTELLKPAPSDDVNEAELHAKRVLQRIKVLKAQMSNASDIEQRRLKAEVEALLNLLSDV